MADTQDIAGPELCTRGPWPRPPGGFAAGRGELRATGKPDIEVQLP